jgi:apolipoprotein N-acyltransferase
MFPALVRARVRAGAGLLVNLTNDSWLADDQYSMQALDIARVRAIEVRRPLVRASTSGPSAFVDDAGRVTAATAAFTRGTVAGEVAPGAGLTFYARFGDAFGLLCATAVLVALARAARARQRSYAGTRVRASRDASAAPSGRLDGSGARSNP